MHRPHPAAGRRAFTLIELLVVLGIIALLIGILVPVLSRARGATRDAICRSNMKQLVVATVMYQNDYRQYFPQPDHDNTGFNSVFGGVVGPIKAGESVWFNALDTYLMQATKNYSSGSTTERNYKVFKQDPVWLDYDEAIQDVNRTIKMNRFIGNGDDPGFQFYKLTQIPNPSRTVLFVDGRANDTPSVTTGSPDTSPNGSPGFSVTPIYVGLRHDKGANVAKVDGSVDQHKNSIRQMPTGYQGWYTDTETDGAYDPANVPDVIFDFN